MEGRRQASDPPTYFQECQACWRAYMNSNSPGTSLVASVASHRTLLLDSHTTHFWAPSLLELPASDPGGKCAGCSSQACLLLAGLEHSRCSAVLIAGWLCGCWDDWGFQRVTKQAGRQTGSHYSRAAGHAPFLSITAELVRPQDRPPLKQKVTSYCMHANKQPSLLICSHSILVQDRSPKGLWHCSYHHLMKSARASPHQVIQFHLLASESNRVPYEPARRAQSSD